MKSFSLILIFCFFVSCGSSRKAEKSLTLNEVSVSSSVDTVHSETEQRIDSMMHRLLNISEYLHTEKTKREYSAPDSLGRQYLLSEEKTSSDNHKEISEEIYRQFESQLLELRDSIAALSQLVNIDRSEDEITDRVVGIDKQSICQVASLLLLLALIVLIIVIKLKKK